MIHKLQFRLLLAFILVIFIAIGTASVFASLTLSSHVERYENMVNQEHYYRAERLLLRYFLERGSWSGVQPVVQYASSIYDRRIILTDIEGIVIADSADELIGKQFELEWEGMSVPRIGPLTLGAVFISPDDNDPTSPARLLQAMNLFLIIGGVLALIVATVVTIFISRKFLQPVRELTDVAGHLGLGDFSRRVHVSDTAEIGLLASSFNTMAEGLEKAETLRRNMVSDVAHELRTPVSIIRGQIEAIQDNVLQPDTDTLNSIHDETMLLARLIDDLQELSLVEAGRMTLDLQPADAAELVGRAVDSMQAKALAQGIDLVRDINPGLLCSVDEHRIGQVLRNLLSNALAHTNQGGKVHINAHKADTSIQVCIEDNGEGIPAEDLPYIFERFYRVDKSRNRSTGGSGLGLTIARRLVEAHGGKIWAQTNLDRGSSFCFTLPAL